jgi:hypothetical protein
MVAGIHFIVYLTVIRLNVIRAENMVDTEMNAFLII